MKEFIDLLKNKILPALTVRAKLKLIINQISQIITMILNQKLLYKCYNGLKVTVVEGWELHMGGFFIDSSVQLLVSLIHHPTYRDKECWGKICEKFYTVLLRK